MTPETHAAIVADYAEGHPLASITAEHGVSRATIHRIARAAGLPHRKRGPAAVRPVRKCACGSPTTSKTGTCRLCQRSARIDEAEGEVGLPKGDWVLDRRTRVLVWQERPEPPKCGTELGYWWHRYNDRDNWPLPINDPCGCRAAHRDHTRALRAQRETAA